jgi:hypothetical protein
MATFANNKKITKLWPCFRLCSIIEPMTLTSSVSPNRKPRKERNSSLGNAAPLLQSNDNINEAMNAYTHIKQNPSKILHQFSNLNHSK